MSDEELELINSAIKSAKKETKYAPAIQFMKSTFTGLIIPPPSAAQRLEIDMIVDEIMARPKNPGDNRSEQARYQNYFDGFSLEIPVRDILVPRMIGSDWVCKHVNEAGPKDFLLTSPEGEVFFLDTKGMLTNTVTCSSSEREAVRKGTVDEVLLLVFSRKSTHFEFKDVRRARTEFWLPSQFNNSEYFFF